MEGRKLVGVCSGKLNEKVKEEQGDFSCVLSLKRSSAELHSQNCIGQLNEPYVIKKSLHRNTAHKETTERTAKENYATL